MLICFELHYPLAHLYLSYLANFLPFSLCFTCIIQPFKYFRNLLLISLNAHSAVVIFFINCFTFGNNFLLKFFVNIRNLYQFQIVRIDMWLSWSLLQVINLVLYWKKKIVQEQSMQIVFPSYCRTIRGKNRFSPKIDKTCVCATCTDCYCIRSSVCLVMQISVICSTCYNFDITFLCLRWRYWFPF